MLKEQIDAIAEVRDEYNLKVKIKLVLSPMMSGDLGMTNKGGDVITINKYALRNREITDQYLNADNYLSASGCKGIAYHEMGHVVSRFKGEKGFDIARKLCYNILKREPTTKEVLAFLKSNISLYSTYIPEERKSSYEDKYYREVTPEFLSMDKTNPNEFTAEFIRLLKEAYSI